MNTNNRAAGYIRISEKQKDLKEGELDSSLINQEAAIREYCKKNNLQCVKIYMDKYRSGADPYRPQFLQMQSDAEAGNFDFVIIKSLDRFTRQGSESQQDYLYYFASLAVEVISLSEDVKNEMTRETFGFINRMFIIIFKMKYKFMVERKINQGRAFWIAPLGYKNLKKQDEYWKVKTDDAAKVKLAFQLKAQNRTIKDIAENIGITEKATNSLLNNINYVGIRINDKNKSILFNRFYIKNNKKEVISVEKNTYFGYHEPLISPEDWIKIHPEDKENQYIQELLQL
jgi:DNA invertase Pin-like site-specific DNA recombinase